jgi:hypothetical protein
MKDFSASFLTLLNKIATNFSRPRDILGVPVLRYLAKNSASWQQ